MGEFKGYFITSSKAGKFPEKYINYDTYKSTPDSISELNSSVNSNNVLVRKTAKNRRSKIEFNTRPITDTELAEIWAWIESNITNKLEDRLDIIAWNERRHCYMKYDVYVPDITYSGKGINDTGIKYDSIRFAFITYSEGTEVE
jgi:hypothetical protein